MPKDTRRARETALHRREILQAAKRLFAQKGFAATTIEEIAQQADLSKGAMYGHFDSKEDLFLSLIHEKNDELEHRIQEVAERPDDPLTRIRALIETQLGFFEDDKEFFQILASEHPRLEAATQSRLRDQMKDRYLRWSDLVGRVMAAGVSSGLLRDLDPRFLVAGLWGLIHAFTAQWILTSCPSSLASAAPVIESLFLDGARKSSEGAGEMTP